MNKITQFSQRTIKEIGHYVYRLVDPRNGQTFYVGQGQGNRVFQHVKDAEKHYKNIDLNKHDFDSDSKKLKTIREIYDASLEVIYIIHRWHLTKEEADEVEAALIDAYPGLTNLQSGHGSDYCMCNALELEKKVRY